MARRLAAAAAVGAMLVGSAAQAELRDTTLRVDWTLLGYHAPFFLGKERGYYEEAGIALDIREGRGSSNVITLVGHDSDDFGFADATTAARLIGEGLPVQVVQGVFQRSTLSIFLPADKGVNTAEDLRGKTVSMCPGDGLSVYMVAYLTTVGVNPAEVRTAMVDCSAKYTVVAQGLADGVASYGTAGRPLMNNVGIAEVSKLDYADEGLVLPSHGIIASKRMIEGSPDLVRGFVEATARAWEDARADPEAAVAAIVAANSLLEGREDALLATLLEAFEYMETPGIEGRPFGYQSGEEWQIALETLQRFAGLSDSVVPDQVFTNQFVAD